MSPSGFEKSYSKVGIFLSFMQALLCFLQVTWTNPKIIEPVVEKLNVPFVRQGGGVSELNFDSYAMQIFLDADAPVRTPDVHVGRRIHWEGRQFSCSQTRDEFI